MSGMKLGMLGNTKHFPMALDTKIKNHPLLFPRQRWTLDA
jgi:hypothetical protein